MQVRYGICQDLIALILTPVYKGATMSGSADYGQVILERFLRWLGTRF